MATLADWLARQEQAHARSIDLGLERISGVAQALGLLPPPFAVLTVGGTNGKGSTVAFIESLLRAGGVATGVFTSPHLVRYNERVRIGGAAALDAELIEAFERIEAARGPVSLTFFEYSTLAALEIFVRHGVEAAVLEVGLGGRLDATNIVDADVAVVTSIGLDHCEWLGDTLEAIGREKAGIFRRDRPAVLASPELPASVREVGSARGARAFAAGTDYCWEKAGTGWHYRSSSLELRDLRPPGLAGDVQLSNAAAALAALECLEPRLPAAARALERERASAALAATHLPGRFQIVPGPVEWVLDVAHNEPAARVLAANLARLAPARSTLGVCGMLSDKDVGGIVRALAGRIDRWLLCSIQGPRGLSAVQLRERFPLDADLVLEPGVTAGLASARAGARPGDRIVVFGSFLTVGPALEWLGLY